MTAHIHLLFLKEKKKKKAENHLILILSLISIRGQFLYSGAKTRGIAQKIDFIK